MGKKSVIFIVRKWRLNEKKIRKKKKSDGKVDFYFSDYSEEHRLNDPMIRDLSLWRCHRHRARSGHRIYCDCGKPMVQQICMNAKGEIHDDLNKEFKGLYCNNTQKGLCDTKIITPNQTVFRCMNGARCKETKDGTDYCMKCIVNKLAKYKPKIYCLCGNYLVLGNGHDVKDIFNKKENYKMEKEDSSSLETDDVSLCSPSTPNCAKSVSPPNSTRCIKR